MPETAVNEHNQPGLWKHKIRFPEKRLIPTPPFETVPGSNFARGNSVCLLDNHRKAETMLAEMKKVFAITISEDEPPWFQVADQAADVVSGAFDRAKELDLSVTDHPIVEVEGEYPDFDDFLQRYTLVENRFDAFSALDGCLFACVGEELEAVRNAPPENLWTLIESEELWWFARGFHYVNCLGYLLTNESSDADERQYLYD